MIQSDETQKIFREKKFINHDEIVLVSGDIILAENVLTKERRILESQIVSKYLNTNNIVESKSKSQLLKG